MTRRRRLGVEGEIDRLFALPLAEFTGARNTLGTRLRDGGDAEAAARIKALAKPSFSAWAVNQLYWRFPAKFETLLECGEQLREIQQRGAFGDVDVLREASERRRAALATLKTQAQKVLEGAGHTVTQATERRIETTLEAAATFGMEQPEPGPGRLSRDLEAQGFDALLALAASPPDRAFQRKPRSPEPVRDRTRERAEARVAQASSLAREAQAARDAAAAEAEEARVQLQAATERLRQARTRSRRADAALKAAQAAAKKAGAVLRRAERALESPARRSR